MRKTNVISGSQYFDVFQWSKTETIGWAIYRGHDCTVVAKSDVKRIYLYNIFF